MIPAREDAPSRPAAVVVGGLIAANAVVFLYELVLSGGAFAEGEALREFFARWGLIPREFLREIATPGATGQVIGLTPFSSMFVHAGLVHLVSNLLYLWVFGSEIEARLGHGRFLIFYLLCGLAAASIQIASDPGSYIPIVGASGAISGLLGAYAIFYPGRRLRLLSPRVSVRAALLLIVWIVIQVLTGIHAQSAEEGGAAWWAHVGGFAAGIALARLLRARLALRSNPRI
jgi:membrane associated rhomboid family serine protease